MLQKYKKAVTPLLRLSATNQSNSPPPHPSCRSKTKQWQENAAAFLVANFLEIELRNLTLLILLGGGTYDSCDRISWRVLPTWP